MPTVQDVLKEARKRREAEGTVERLDQLFAVCLDDPKTRNFEKLWQVSCLLGRPNAFVQTWSLREQGQVAGLRKKLGSDVLAAVLKEVPRRWVEFCSMLAEKRGHRKLGETPSIGLLTVHHGAAVEWLEETASACTGGGTGFGQSW